MLDGQVSGRRIGWAMATLVALALAALALAMSAGPAAAATAKAAAAPAKAKLVRFPSCERFLRYSRRQARKLVEPYGLAGYPSVTIEPGRTALPPGAEAAPAAPAPAAARDAGAQGGAPNFSGTNLQEAGVDEPDIVKTDGRRIFAIAGGKLHAVEAAGGASRLLGSLELKDVYPNEILLQGDRLLLIASEAYDYPFPLPRPVEPGPASVASDVAIFPPPPPPATVLIEVDVSDPAAMNVATRLKVEGNYVAARMTGTTARLVVASTPAAIPLATPAGSTPVAEARAEARNLRAVARTTVRNFIPRLQVKRKGRIVRTGNAVPCRSVTHTARFAGLGMVNVLTLDFSNGLVIADRDAVMTDGTLVYASPTNLYIASPRWFSPEIDPATADFSGSTTQVHRFDISAPLETEYRGSGTVRGFPLNQFAFSEHAGHLRVATTEDPPFNESGAQAGESESFVTVLALGERALGRVGRVGGLGRGERIQAVRFLGDRGYVVTFRQVDPLYTLDLSDPRNPAVRGELKIPGFSSYLQPVGDHRLIGIGQDATAEGRVTGSQVSLFDVSDPAQPRRLAQHTLGSGYSEAKGDHHAVLFWESTGLLAIPFQSYGDGAGPPPFTGAVGLRVDPAGSLSEIGRVSHPAITETEGYTYNPSVRRSLVVGDTLYTLSENGVGASELTGLAHRGFVPFAP